jgi:DNA-binding NarL/FixJ family response regulator
MAIRIIAADDHPFVLLGVQSMLKMHAGVTFVGEAGTPTALFALLQHAPCDVLVTDLSMPDPSGVNEDGLSLIRRIRHAWPQLRIVVMTMLTDTSMLREIVAQGAVIALSKSTSMDELWRAIEASAKGVAYRPHPCRHTRQLAGREGRDGREGRGAACAASVAKTGGSRADVCRRAVDCRDCRRARLPSPHG